MILLFWVGAGILLLVLAAGLFFGAIVVLPRRHGLEESFRVDVDKGRIDPAAWESWEKREVAIKAADGVALRGTWFPLAGAAKTVILLHGVTWTRNGSLKYLPSFRSRGFNVLAIDHRRHGASGGSSSTFGWYERRDVSAWIDWILGEMGPSSLVGSHGESMGAAIALQHAAIDPRLSFVVADCPFSDLCRLLAFRLHEDYHLPPFPFMNLAAFSARLISGGMRFKDISPLRDVLAIKAPVLFIHGDADGYIPPGMSREMHEARLSAGLPTRLYLAPGAGHAEAYQVDPPAYDREIGAFLMDQGLA
jgi:fermentation-respiration switch protein FrsA (DUF1100 family)